MTEVTSSVLNIVAINIIRGITPLQALIPISPDTNKYKKREARGGLFVMHPNPNVDNYDRKPKLRK